jgi:transglutaminase superfamily protein
MAAWILVLSVLVRYRSLPGALRTLSVGAHDGSSQIDQEIVRRLTQSIDLLLAMDVFVFRPSCWKRAAILHRYLALYGIESRINFGIRKEPDGTFKGHAWLEHLGTTVSEASTPNYTVTYSFPGTTYE